MHGAIFSFFFFLSTRYLFEKIKLKKLNQNFWNFIVFFEYEILAWEFFNKD